MSRLVYEYLKTYHNKKILPVTFGMGIGKTYNTIKYCEDNSYKYLLVVPNESNILDILSNHSNITPYYNKEKTISDKMVTTYASLENLLSKNSDFDAVIFDEFHIVILDRTFRDFTASFDNLLEKLKCKQIFITATPFIFKNIEYNNLSKYFSDSVERSIINIPECHIHTNITTKDAYNIILDNDFDVIYHDDTSAYFKYGLYEYELIHRYNLHNKWDMIIDTNKQLTKKIFTTKCINTGINIMNKGKMKIAVICSGTTIIDIIQLLGRFRQADLEVHFFLVTDFIKYINIKVNNNYMEGYLNTILSQMCMNIDDIKYILEYFEPFNKDINIIKHDNINDVYHTCLRFFESRDVHLKYRNNFIKIKNKNKNYYVYNKDLERLPDKILLSDTQFKDIRTLKTLLLKLNLNISPIKKNRRIIGYKIS